MTDPGKPTFGHTRRGRPVHARTLDHLPDHSLYARFNKRVAIAATRMVGSMSCAWAFCLIALVSLPAVLTLAFHVKWFPHWLVSAGLIALVAWVAQTFLQLVLLSVIMVGQSVQSLASDARSAKTFEDAEAIKDAIVVALDRLDTRSKGGLREVLDAQAKMGNAVKLLAAEIAPAPDLLPALQAHIDDALTAAQEKLASSVLTVLTPPAKSKARKDAPRDVSPGR